jgi:tryptophan 2,3-dioxygenase
MTTPGPPAPENPIYHSTKLTYGSYLKVPELLNLQHPRTDHHDELLFIQAHQVYELWFKQMLHELAGPGGVCERLDRDEPLRAAQLLERIHKIQSLLIEQLPLLETMFSTEFAKFRDALRPASGFQSVQFRKIEFLCGNKNPKMLALVGEDDAARAEMATFLDKPTPYDHFIRHLAREDNDVFKVPREFLTRDTNQPHEEDPQLVNSLEILYRKHDEWGSKDGERYYAQVKVAEQLLEFDERFQIWRFGHVKMVERMIGSMTGTGGSSGAKYLASTIKSFWPDLWSVRSRFGGAAAYAGH